jgi:hypothetical protein
MPTRSARLVGRGTLPALACALTLSCAAAAVAAGPDYVGTWTGDLAQCKTAQDQKGAPLIIAKDRYDQHNSHCKFTSVEGEAPDWKIKADCAIDGKSEAREFTLTASGNTLSLTNADTTNDLLRCK